MRRFRCGAICVGLALIAFGCARFGSRSAALDPVLERLAPPSTRLIAGADIGALRDPQVNPKYLSLLDLFQLTGFLESAGIDPRQDLERVIACSSGGPPVLLARARLDSYERRLQAGGQPRFVYKGHTLFGPERSAVMFVDSQTLASGPPEDLRAMIDGEGASPHGLAADLKNLVSTLPASAQVWAAFDGGLDHLTSSQGSPSNLDSLLNLFRGVETGTLWFDLRRGLEFHAQLDCDNSGHARHVHDAIRGFIELGRATANRRGALPREVYDAIQVNQIETRVQVTAFWTPNLAGRVLDLLKHGG